MIGFSKWLLFIYYVAVLDVVGDALDDHHEGDEIFAALRDDDIRVALGRLHKLLVHGLDRREILLHDGLQRPAALLDVP